MKILATMKCYLKAMRDLFLHGVWVPHVYRNVDYEKCTIISTEHGFRVSTSLQHERGEIYASERLPDYEQMYLLW